MRLILTAMFLFSLGALLADDSVRDKFSELVASGDAHLAEFNNIEAFESYARAYWIDRDNYDLLLKVTIACNNSGEDSKSAIDAEKYFEQAVLLAEETIAKFPDRAVPYFLLGASLGNLADYKGMFERGRLAKRIYLAGKKCIELDPDYGPGYVILGMYYRQIASLSWLERKAANKLSGLAMGTLEDSRKMLETAVAKSPDEIYPNYQLAVTLQSMGKKEAAAKFYRKVIALPVTDHEDKAKQEDAEKQLAGMKK